MISHLAVEPSVLVPAGATLLFAAAGVEAQVQIYLVLQVGLKQLRTHTQCLQQLSEKNGNLDRRISQASS